MQFRMFLVPVHYSDSATTELNAFLASHRVVQIERKWIEQGISFLGCRLFSTHVELNRLSKQRWQRRVYLLEKAHRLGLLSDLDLQSRLASLTAFARGGGVRSWKFRHSVLEPSQVDEP